MDTEHWLVSWLVRWMAGWAFLSGYNSIQFMNLIEITKTNCPFFHTHCVLRIIVFAAIVWPVINCAFFGPL